MYGKPKFITLLLRLSLGWVFFYSGLTKILNSDWTAKGYLEGAQTLGGFFTWLASPQNITWVNFLNEWGQLAIGVALILGVFVNYASFFGAAMVILYYFPVLDFPFVENGFLIDDHIIYALAFLLLIRLRAGRSYSIMSFFGRHPY